MSDYPSDLRYTREHEWVRKEKDGTLTVGITSFAAKQLGDVVFVDLLDGRNDLEEGDEFATIESVKAVSEVFTPVAGKVTARNGDLLAESPETVNDDPYGDGWLIKLRPSDAKAFDGLMTAAKYADYVKQED